MDGNFTRLKILFLGLFALICAGMWGYDALYVWPRKTCEARGDWWDDKDRICGVPIPLTRWTGRPGAGPKAPIPPAGRS